jgi:hypothetical protein
MIVTGRHLPRRTFLRGLGATVALPLLDGMVPAFASARTAAAQPVKRLGIVYVPNGIQMNRWTPAGVGGDFEFTQILKPMEPFRSHLLVLSGMADKPGNALPGEGAGDHARASATFLTGVHARKTEGADLRAGVSMDQIAAQHLGRETQLASLELALESNEFLGACDAGYSCAYSNTLCWRSESTPLPMENDPRAVFERLFGSSDSTGVAARLARIEEERSILDAISSKLADLKRRVGPKDLVKLDEYTSAIRDVERRIQRAEEQSARELPVVARPAGIPASFEDHAKLMFDLQVLAYQTDLTRVITFMVGREVSSRAYPEIGVPDPHHPLSHHQGDVNKIEKLVRINVLHLTMFAYYLEKLRTTPDGDGSLLDHAMIVYGSGMSDGNSHSHHNLPILLAGGGAGHLSGGRHVQYPKDMPLTNLYVSLLDKLGVPAERFGDSTGKAEYLSEL